MKALYPSRGYTIIEALIFLAVSTALFGSVVGAMTQQSRRKEFTQSIENLQVRLQDALNDVSTGYYPSNRDIKCSSTSSGPNITVGASNQGTNVGCIFVGSAIKFDENGTFKMYSMVGNRQIDRPPLDDVRDLEESRPKLLGIDSNPGLFDQGELLEGIEIEKVINLEGSTGAPEEIGGFALVSTFSQKDPVTNSVSGNASKVTLKAVNSSILTMPDTTFAQNIRISRGNNLVDAPKGILICILEGNRRASITIGGNSETLSLDRTVDGWPTGPGKCS